MIALKKLCTVAVLSVGTALFLAGCGPSGLPRSASKCNAGPRPACTSPSAGTFWVFDKSSHSTVYTGAVERNQDISVDPASGQITIDGNPVQSGNVPSGHEYEIYFAPAGAK